MAEFVCPQCGGRHFGRDVERNREGKVTVLDWVRCHDEHNVRCKWQGELTPKTLPEGEKPK